MKKKVTLAIAVILAIISVVLVIKATKKTEITETVADGVQQIVEMQTTAATLTKAHTTEVTTETTTKKRVSTRIVTETYIYSGEQGEHTTPLGTFRITGYTAEEGFPEGSATASGIGCRVGICAMNNAQRKELGIEWGDTIYIEGLGSYQVQDCGCAYGVIDIWLHTNAQAYAITGNYEVYR